MRSVWKKQGDMIPFLSLKVVNNPVFYEIDIRRDMTKNLVMKNIVR